MFLIVEIFLLYLFFRKRKLIKYLNFLLIIFFLSFFLTTLFSRPHYNLNLLNRLLLVEIEDWKSVYSRIENFKKAVDLFVASPIFGVGLGNYQVYIKDLSNFFTFEKTKSMLNSQTLSDPHSILSKTLSESGFIGTTVLIIMTFFFLMRDFFFIKRYKNNEKFFLVSPYVISFWSYFAVILITPSITLFRGGWFWFLRGIIEGFYSKLKLSQ